MNSEDNKNHGIEWYKTCNAKERMCCCQLRHSNEFKSWTNNEHMKYFNYKYIEDVERFCEEFGCSELQKFREKWWMPRSKGLGVLSSS